MKILTQRPMGEDAEEPVSPTDTAVEVELEEFSDSDIRPRLPVIKGGMVVYLGSASNKSVALTGRIYIEARETGETRPDGTPEMFVTESASDEGVQAYDFTTHDAMGRIIRMRHMKDTAAVPRNARNRPCSKCEHPEHLRQFLRMRNASKEREFTILVPPDKQGLFADHVRRRENALGMKEAQFTETVSRG